MKEKEELMEVGLTKRQAEAYLALLQLEEASVKEIADKTKESRTHLYDTLKNLLDRGLVSYVTKNNIKYFHAAPPEKILDYLHEKETLLLKILPSLKEQSNAHWRKPRVGIYEGQEGIKTILNDIIRTKKDWLAISSTGGGPLVLHDFFIERLHKERAKNKIKLKVLFNDSEDAKKRAVAFSKLPLTEYKFLPAIHQSPATTYIYGDKTVIIMWIAIGKPFALLIESEEISESFRNYFNLLWRTL